MYYNVGVALIINHVSCKNIKFEAFNHFKINPESAAHEGLL
jgi:hypothetical protein